MLDLKKFLVSLAFFIIMHCISKALHKKQEEGFAFYEVRRGNIGYSGDKIAETKGKWIKVASINMKQAYSHKALTLELYPKKIGHGTTRQSFSVVLRNNDADAMNPLVYYNNKYGNEGGISISDINVLRNGTGINNIWDMWLKMGVSHAEEFPCEWHLENIEENDMVMIESSRNMLSAPPADLPKFGMTKNIKSSGDLENKNNDLQRQVNNLQNRVNSLQSQITNNHTNLQNQINGRVAYNSNLLIQGTSGHLLLDQHHRDHSIAKFKNYSHHNHIMRIHPG